MKQRHVILRATGFQSRGGLESISASPLERQPTGLAVEIDTLNRDRAVEVLRNRDVLAVAPVFPMRLVQPRPEPAVQALAGGTDWGVQATGADTSPFTGAGIVAAVLDTGIDPAHPAFDGVQLVQKNFTDDGNGNDAHGHGTHCAGTIFGRDVGGTRIGVARGIKKALIGKVLGERGGGSDQIVSAIQWAVNEGANVISMSLGIDFPGAQRFYTQQLGLPEDIATSRALEGYRQNVLLFERMAATVRALGNFMQASILVAAAGNESRTDENPEWKIAVSPPAVSEGIISVAALGRGPAGFEVATFSNTGAMVAGPGVGITSARPGGGLVAMSGTSMATPHVAGLAALWGEKLRALGPLSGAALTARLIASGSTHGLRPGFDPADVGTGLCRAPQE